jgi:hypothetical protein
MERYGTESEDIWSDVERSLKIYEASGVVLACVDGSVVVVSCIWCYACMHSLTYFSICAACLFRDHLTSS